MQALRKVASGPGNMALVEVAEPQPGPTDVVMRVWAAGICGSDLLIEDDRHFYRAPVTIGHEFSGIVERTGSGVTKVKPGDRITGDIETSTGWLGVTRDGSAAPFMTIPEAQVHAYPEDVPLDHIALTEPVVAIVHALQERTRVRPGDFLVVVGPGPMGLLGVQYGKLCGARAVALVGLRADTARLALGARLGADYVLHSEDHPERSVLELTGGRGADVILECSGSGTGLQHALDSARRSPEGRGGRGQIAVISLWGEPITIDADALSLHQLSLQGSWSWNGAETWERAIDLVTRGVLDLDPLITGHYPLEGWHDAFASLREKRDVKALIHPNGQDW